MYVGFWSQDQFKKNQKALREIVYQGWDNMAGAPPQSRPLEENEVQSAPSLQIIAWQNGAPHWPDFLNTKYPEGSDEAQMLSQRKAVFLEKFPAQPAPRTGTTVRPGRAGGLCDFSIDNGAKPLDVTREIQPEHVGEADFNENRLGACDAKGMRPSIVITSSFEVWIGNPSQTEGMNVEAQELFGFGIGDFEEREVESGQDPVPVTFRYKVAPKENFVTHVFKPKNDGSGREAGNMFRAQALGTVFHQNYDKIISNKKAGVVWEARFPPKDEIEEPPRTSRAKRRGDSEAATPRPKAKAKSTSGPSTPPHPKAKASPKAKATGKAKAAMKRPSAAAAAVEPAASDADAPTAAAAVDAPAEPEQDEQEPVVMRRPSALRRPAARGEEDPENPPEGEGGDTVGGKFRSVAECKEIADTCVRELRSGKPIEEAAMFAELPMDPALGRAAAKHAAARAGAPAASDARPADGDGAPAASAARPADGDGLSVSEDPEAEERVIHEVLQVSAGLEFGIEEGEEEAKENDEAVDVN
eukprot:s1511_g15.t1